MENQISVLSHLASSIGRRDQNPNKELAEKIIRDNKTDWIKELVNNVNNKSRVIQGDCIKVLDEISAIKPELISPYTEEILQILKSKNNRMIWGSMAVLDNICLLNPSYFFNTLPDIMSALDSASVITRDHGVKILTKLAKTPDYYQTVWPLYIEQLQNSPENQFPSYTEWGAAVVQKQDLGEFIAIIKEHLLSINQTSRINRLNKVLKALQKNIK